MGLLLDTCAVIWLATGAPMAAAGMEALAEAGAEGRELRVAPMSAWEIGMLASRGRLALTSAPEVWFAHFMARPGLVLADATPQTLIASSFLPGTPPRDPVDRILIATARAEGLRIVTRDRIMLDYAAAGHVGAVAC